MASGRNANRSVVIAFDVVAIVMIVLLLVIVFTAAYARQVKRRACWFGFMFPVTFYQGSFLLLLGAQDHTQPPFVSCVLQAILIYSLPV